MVTVGIPRALAYYDYGCMWSRFFSDLGVDVVLSPHTNKAIVDAGVKLAADGTCLPIKAFYGHAAHLAQRTDLDYLFIPRIIGVREREFICPKFMGLPDMIVNGLRNQNGTGPRVLAPLIDLRKGRYYSFAAVAKMAVQLGVNPIMALHLYREALSWYDRERMQSGLSEMGRQGNAARDRLSRRLTIGVIGHTYLVEDRYLSMNLVGKLGDMGVHVIPGHRLPRDLVDQKALEWPKQMFWRSGRIAFGVTRAFLEDKPYPVDGAVYVAAFGCGTDSMVAELVEREFRRNNKPLLTVNLDEHTGEAGLLTRLEAFVDLIRWRVERSEMYIPTHG